MHRILRRDKNVFLSCTSFLLVVPKGLILKWDTYNSVIHAPRLVDVFVGVSGPKRHKDFRKSVSVLQREINSC